MPNIPFPTRPTYNANGRAVTPGTPEEAAACKCMDQLVFIEGECFLCGRLLAETIRQTFEAQAKKQQRGERISPFRVREELALAA